jgi:hypothetical protein
MIIIVNLKLSSSRSYSIMAIYIHIRLTTNAYLNLIFTIPEMFIKLDTTNGVTLHSDR